MKHHSQTGNWGIAIMLASLTAILLTVTAPAIGLTWDEPVYIAGANSYAKWFGELVKNPAKALMPTTIDTFWRFNHLHPPVESIWSGLIWLAVRHSFDELTANRLGPILLVALLVVLLFQMVAGTYGKAAGLFAVLALISMPRFFFHAHLTALDVPVTVASFAVTFLFWKTVDKVGWVWGLVWGIAWGLAVAIKLNAVFIPIALMIWFIIFRRKWLVALRLFLMGLVAVPTFFMVWPWLYYHPWARVMEYVNFHLHHYPVGAWYFGKYYAHPPWHFAFVMLWAVVPLTVMLLFLVGTAHAGNGKRDGGLVWLLIVSAFVSISPFIFGKSVLYDNDRLFMPVFPFLAALAGIGYAWLINCVEKLAERIKRPALAISLAIVITIALLMPQSLTMVKLFPHLLSYYSEGVGGLPGATKLGLETTYWCETYAAALPYINTHAKPGDVIWAEPWSSNVLLYYQKIGRLRQDVSIWKAPPTSPPFPKDANWYIFQYRQAQYRSDGEEGYLPLRVLVTQAPVYTVEYRSIPLMKLYGSLK